MGGEQQNRNVESEVVDSTEWDILTEQGEAQIEESEVQTEEPELQESTEASENSKLFTRKMTEWSPDSKLEKLRRGFMRKIAPNTMPGVERLAEDVDRSNLSYVQELCDNWPLYAHTEKVTIEGKEIDFPKFFPEIVYDGGRDFVGFLSTPERPEEVYEEIKKQIGKKNASVYIEACLDNPLVARVQFGRYRNNANSDHTTVCEGSDSLLHSRVRLVDEALPLLLELERLNSRLSGIEYNEFVASPEEKECRDTLERAMIAYHEIGHDVDFLMNFVRLYEKGQVKSAEITAAQKESQRRRAMDLGCSKSFPGKAMESLGYITTFEMSIMAARRGFDPSKMFVLWRAEAYNERRYREMPSEVAADTYAREAVCKRHRDHYYARNQHERDTNPEKKNLPIYGEIIGIGSKEVHDPEFVDSELMNCGLIAGRRVSVYEEYIDPEIEVDPSTLKTKLPDDFNYKAYQEKQKAQRKIVTGVVKYNPQSCYFELVDDNGETIIALDGPFYRQMNDEGVNEIIVGDFSGEKPTYRLRIEYTEEDAKEFEDVVQIGPTDFDRYVGVDESTQSCVLLVSDNAIRRVLLPKGGFCGIEPMIVGDDGSAMNLPNEFFIMNGIPKVKIGEVYYEVVKSSEESLETIKRQLASSKEED